MTVPAPLTSVIARASWLPAADPECSSCAGVGWVGSPVDGLLPTACACVGRCPACGGSGFLRGGGETCACRTGRERVAELGAVGLPWPDEVVLPVALERWISRFRPEPGWPWLTVHGPDAAVVLAAARLLTAVGVPTDRARPGTPDRTDHWRRLVVALDLAAFSPEEARRLVDACQARDLILLASTSIPVFPSEGPGLESVVGEVAAVALHEHGEVVDAA